jgi:glycosyltransferase involved in cell wall biosynthesis
MESPDKDSQFPGVEIVAPFPPPNGGMSLQAEKLWECLAAEGIDVELIATNPSPPARLWFVRSVPGLRTMVRETQYLWSLLRKPRTVGIIHHLAASGAYFFLHSVPLLVLGRHRKARLVLNYRGGNAARFLRRWAWLVVPLMRLADQIAVPSEFLQRVFREYGLTASLVPNIADTELFSYKQRNTFRPRLIVTRNLEPMYNVECVLRAFHIVQSTFPQAILGIAGTGSEESRLRKRVHEWQLAGVSFYGAVAHRDLPSLYAEHDIFVNASNVDNFPGALLEAACSGLCIVTTRAGGIPDMIRDHVTGLLVNLNDHQALANGVLECLEQQDLARNLARRARTWVEQFAWANVFPKLMECYGLPLAVGSKAVLQESRASA